MTKTRFKKEKSRILQLFNTPNLKQITKEKQEKIKKKASENFFFFFKTYLPHYAVNKAATFQKEIVSLLNSNNKYIAIAAPRGFSKSTLVSFAYVIWAVIFKKYRFIVIISATDDLSEDLSQFIRLEFGDNPLILRDFGNLLKDKGAEGDFIVNETRIFARGKKQANRGFRYREHRPDLIILDDIEKDEESLSSSAVNKTIEIINRALVPSLSPQGKLIAIGTILRKSSAFAKLVLNDNPYWEKKIFKALMVNNKNQEFSIWEDRFSTEFLVKQRDVIGLSAFNSEYQNCPSDEESSIFKEEMLIADSIDPCMSVAFIDPSIDGVKNGDYKVCALIRGSSKKIEIVDIIAVKGSDRDFFKKICSMYQKYKEYIISIGIESNGFQQYFAKDLKKFAEDECNLILPLKPIKNYIKKEYRIQKLLSWFETKKIVINPNLIESIEGKLMVEQFLFFPNKKVHDDIPDAITGAVDLLTAFENISDDRSSTVKKESSIIHIPSSKKSVLSKKGFNNI